MDLPWNPAVLEQRIGRVHRMGQRRGVQVINLVAQGSIEQGMLGVLAFKKSLFAGVLDGGAGEVMMNGTRLSKFMESVDEVTGAMGVAEEAGAAPAPPGAAEVAEAVVSTLEAAPQAPERAPAAELTAATADPWAPLLDAGLNWLAALGAPTGTPAGAAGATAPSAGPRVTTDPATGEQRLSLPLPDPATVQRLAEGLAGLLARLRG
jgi:hypothetical protein